MTSRLFNQRLFPAAGAARQAEAFPQLTPHKSLASNHGGAATGEPEIKSGRPVTEFRYSLAGRASTDRRCNRGWDTVASARRRQLVSDGMSRRSARILRDGRSSPDLRSTRARVA